MLVRSCLNLMVAAGVLLGAAGAEARPSVGPLYPEVVADDGPRPPWRRRRRVGVKGMRGKGQGLADLSAWPAEPASPAEVDVKRFGRALRTLCAGWMPPNRPFVYARWIVSHARAFDVDPFLLAALVYRQSRCIPREVDSFGAGLARINGRMHGPFVKGRTYHYWVLEDGAWRARTRPMPKFAFVPGNLRRSEPSIYFAAALMSIYKEQCPAIDGAFGSVPHRHYVSHVIWGDRVKGAGAEDRVLRARRRLLEYYRGELPPPRGAFRGLALRCPVDGAPRKITSAMGFDRAGGKRRHRGIDFASTRGEPVRAVADGVVRLAGLDRPRGGPVNLTPEAAQRVPRRKMGPGGLFVMIDHADGLTSAYMHLSSYRVKAGQKVASGQILGRVGRSGAKDSGPHLHFELRHGGRHIDPMPHLEPYVFPPRATYRGRRVIVEQRRQRRRRRIRRWRQRKAARAAARRGAGAGGPAGGGASK